MNKYIISIKSEFVITEVMTNSQFEFKQLRNKPVLLGTFFANNVLDALRIASRDSGIPINYLTERAEFSHPL